MTEYKINLFFEDTVDTYEELFYEGLEEFIVEKVNLQFCN